METSELYVAVHWTARVSALLFAAALMLPVLSRARWSSSARLYVAFLVAHTVHFACVTWLAWSAKGVPLFPGGRSLADAGGWAALFGIFTFFYALAFVGLLSRGRAGAARPRLRLAGRVAIAFIGCQFVGTYVPLIARSPWYVLPTLLVTGAVLADLVANRRSTAYPSMTS